jgi:hypothetical protein
MGPAPTAVQHDDTKLTKNTKQNILVFVIFVPFV